MFDRKVLLQPAYVLHQRTYRDTSALLELFSPECGRIGVVARGVRSSKSRWRGLLQPFQPLLVSWSLRGDLGTLTDAEAQGPALVIEPHLIASGFYLNEVLMRLLSRHDAQVELFSWYDATLRGMSEISVQITNQMSNQKSGDSSGQDSGRIKASSVALEILLRRFELNLLSALGYGLVLDRDVNNNSPVRPDEDYVYHLEYGPVQASPEDNGEQGPGISGRSLLALQSGDLSDENVRVESKRLLRVVLGHYLGPKPLQSRNLVWPMSSKSGAGKKSVSI